MKVYFTASIAGREKLKEEYQTIVKTLQGLGFQVKEVVLSNEGETSPAKISRLIKKSDLMVAEVSFPSVSVGQEIALALEANKPVLALCKEGIKTTLLEINTNDKLQVISYNLKKIKEILQKATQSLAGKVDVRFNFFVPPKIVDYLNWVAKRKRIPRSVYLRTLIEQDMETDSSYQDEEESKD